MAQMLRPGLDESSRYLTQARVELLNPERRRQMDEELAAQAHELSVAEFHKYLTFAIADGALTGDEEKNLLRFGREQDLTDEQMLAYIEGELQGQRRQACGADGGHRPGPRGGAHGGRVAAFPSAGPRAEGRISPHVTP